MDDLTAVDLSDDSGQIDRDPRTGESSGCIEDICSRMFGVICGLYHARLSRYLV